MAVLPDNQNMLYASLFSITKAMPMSRCLRNSAKRKKAPALPIPFMGEIGDALGTLGKDLGRGGSPLEIRPQIAGDFVLGGGVLIADQLGQTAPHADLAVFDRKDAVNAGDGADIAQHRH